MKFLHLSDLHLGKVVRGFSMLEDQRYLLSQVVQAASDHQVDAVIIAGDVYDKHFPPEEAVQLLDDFLSELSRLRISILIIAGNHDSRVRLQFGSRLLRHQSLYIVSSLKEALEPIVLKDVYGEVNFYLLPYVKPAYVRAFLQQEVKTYQESVDLMIRAMHIDTSKRNVLAAHQFVSGAQTCDSESSLSSVGGLDAVQAESFFDFDYTALGHLHSPQQIKRSTIRYGGSLMKYSLSEAHQKKQIVMVEMKEKGETDVSFLPFVFLHDLRECKGSYDEVMAMGFNSPNIYVVPDMYGLTGAGSQDYVKAANTLMKHQMLFGTAYPILNVVDTARFYETCGIKESVLPDFFYNNAVKLLRL